MRSWKLGLMALVVAMMSTAAFAQGGGGGGGGGRRGGGGAGGAGGGRTFDPTAMMQGRLDQIKQRLGASDDEWKALEPAVTKVLTVQQQQGGRGGAMMGGGRGGRGAATGQPQTGVAQAMAELNAVLQDPTATADSIAAKLAGLRSAREKARNDLVSVQKGLKELLTARQEAILVTMGICD